MKAVALVTESIHVEAQCRESIRPFSDLRLRRANSLEQAKRWIEDYSIHGLLVDLKTFLRATAIEREFVNRLVEYIPVGKVRLSPGNDQLTATFGEDNLAGAAVFLELAERVRKMPTTRVMRTHVRQPEILNARAYHPLWGDKALLTNTVDVSRGGVFLLAALAPVLDSLISLEFLELPSEERWKGRVRWVLPWGRSAHHFPGLGLEFIDLSPSQNRLLERY